MADPPKTPPARKRKVAPASRSPAPAAKRPRKPRRVDDEPAIASPAAAGPAGPRLEGHVGAQYLLPLLSGGEARGLPGVVVTRVAFQRAGLGNPMDDVIVTGRDHAGVPATLELQAKRTIAFTANDSVFADVVAMAARAAAKPEFKTTRYELAVAIARTSTKIDQHIQEVLKWARQYQDAGDFFRRLKQTGAAHQAMRDFADAFRGHLRTAGAPNNDEAVWRLLSRFHVFAFDFEQPGSSSTLLARERCTLVLASHDSGRAGELWDSLQQIALDVDAAGGDLDAGELRRRLTSERGFRLAGDRRLRGARERLADMARATLDAIATDVHGVSLDRGHRVAEAESALENSRYLEIRGAGGVGKSGVLKDLAQRMAVESRVVVVAPHRVPGGGWSALQAVLGCDATAAQLLGDLAGAGGGTLFIDGIDRFDDPAQRVTVADLIRAAASVPGFRVVVTARPDFDADAREWLPRQALEDLGEAPPLMIEDLDDDEVAQLAEDPALAALLRPGHPAEKLVRNLYRLGRLVRPALPADGEVPYSEAQMAHQWWRTGDAGDDAGRRDRRRLLRSLAMHSLASSAPMDTTGTPGPTVDALITSGSLRELTAVHVEFAHDVLRDWALGCLLYEEPEHLGALALGAPAPMRLVRGVEMAARLRAESGQDTTDWQTLLQWVSAPGAHGSWRRAVLLALARSERAHELLDRFLPMLSTNDAAILTELVRTAIAIDSQPAAPFWADLGVPVDKLPHDFVVPRGPAWRNLIEWSLDSADRLPHPPVPQFVDLYGRFCSAYLGHHRLSPRIVERLHAWLCEVEAKNHPRVTGGFREWLAAEQAPGLSMTTAQEGELRTAFLGWCRLCPPLAEAYLRGVASHPYRHVLFRQLVRFTGTAAQAAPKALADLFIDVLPEDDEDDDGEGHRLRDLFSHWDNEYFPASPARPPFLGLLQADAEQGLRLVRGVVAHAVRRCSRGRDHGDNRITVPFPTGTRAFGWPQSYMWSRGQPSSIVASALIALEAWAHLRIERGDPMDAVIAEVLGAADTPAAMLLVAVDVMLSHWPQSRGCLWPFAASAELLALDRQRYGHDVVNGGLTDIGWVRHEPAVRAALEALQQRSSRRCALDGVLGHYGLQASAEVRTAMQQALTDEAARLGPPDQDHRAMADPTFAAMSALNQLDPANYSQTPAQDGRTIIEYVPPTHEAQLLAEARSKAEQGTAEVALRGQLMRALTNPPSSPELLQQGLAWATHDATASQADDNADDKEWSERTRVIVAALVMRDGTPELKRVHGAWARNQLLAAAEMKSDRGMPAQQLPYNPAAIAAVGVMAACRDGESSENLLPLLRLASRSDAGMAWVLGADVAAGNALRPELIRSIVRLGVVSAIYALPQHNDDDYRGSAEDYRTRHEAGERARDDAEDTLRRHAVEDELRWLTRGGPEPGWPELPPSRPPKERLRLTLGKRRALPQRVPAVPRQFSLDARAAAGWLSMATDLWGSTEPERLCALVRHCWPWTAEANGVGCGPDEEPGESPYEWNDAYFRASVAAALAGEGGVDQFILKPIEKLPDERFFDATRAVLHKLDALWLNDGRVSDEIVISIRGAVVKRLITTHAWHYVVSKDSSIHGFQLPGALAAIFLGQHVIGQGPRCYLHPPGAARVNVLVPMLTELAVLAAASPFVAVAFLGLLEVQPQASRLPFLACAVAAWWNAQAANAEFWTDHGIGARACAWIDKAVLQDAAAADLLAGSDLMTMMDTLVRCGIPAAKALDERIAARRDGQAP